MIEQRLRSAARAAWLLSLVVVTVLSLLPQVHIPENGAQLDKLCHFSAYAWLGLLAALAFRTPRPVWGAALLTVFAGVLIEVAQQYVGRVFSYADMAANALGAASGVWLGRRVLGLLRRKKEAPDEVCPAVSETPRA